MEMLKVGKGRGLMNKFERKKTYKKKKNQQKTKSRINSRYPGNWNKSHIRAKTPGYFGCAGRMSSSRDFKMLRVNFTPKLT